MFDTQELGSCTSESITGRAKRAL